MSETLRYSLDSVNRAITEGKAVFVVDEVNRETKYGYELRKLHGFWSLQDLGTGFEFVQSE